MLVTFNSKSGNASNTSSETSNERSLFNKGAEPSLKSNGGSSSFKVINSTNGVSSFSKRSRNGCLTCKIRKKKCDEGKPSCSACSRLNKQCFWVDYTSMSEQEIRLLRQKVEEDERHLKLRRRKTRLVSVANSIKLEVSSPSPPAGYSPLPLEESRDSLNTFRYSPAGLRSILNHAPSYRHNSVLNNSEMINNEMRFNNTMQSQKHVDGDENASANDINASNNHNAAIIRSTYTKNDMHSSLPNNHANNDHQKLQNLIPGLGSPIAPYNATDSADKPELRSPSSPSVFLNVLRDLSHQRELRDTKEDDVELVAAERWENNAQLKELFSSSNFSALMDSIPFESSHQTAEEHNILSSPNFIDNIIPNLNSIFSPLPPTPPTYITALSNPSYAYLYSYYANTLSQKISIAPPSQFESNSYQKVFLPLAHQDKGVLYGILAWSAFHLSGKWASVGTKLVNLALEHIKQSLTDLQGNKFQGYDRHSCLLKLSTLLILCGAEICKGDVKNWSIFLSWASKILLQNGGILNFNKLKEEHWLISNFAYHDVLSSSCTVKGTYFLPKEYDMILEDQQGFSKGNLSPLLGASKSLYLIIGEISTLNYESKQILNHFYGVTTNDFNSPREVTDTVSIDYSEEDSEASEHKKTIHVLSSIIDKSKALDKKIESAHPDPDDLVGLTDQEVELQLTLFEAFQISCKLFLMQSILKCNPSMLEIRVLNTNLTKCIDVLLESPMQASLVFPIFIAGIHCITKAEREEMLLRMDAFMKFYGPWNIRNVKVVTQMVWERNPHGDKCVDWHRILEELGWDMNFAWCTARENWFNMKEYVKSSFNRFDFVFP